MSYVAHLHISVPLMAPVDHIATKVNNIAAESWAWQGIIRFTSAVGKLLQDLAWLLYQPRTHRPVTCIIYNNNKELDAVSQLTPLYIS